MFRDSFRAGMTTLTVGASGGGTALSLSSDFDPRTRIAVTIGVIIQGSAAMSAMVVPVTPESYARGVAAALSAISLSKIFHPSRKLGTCGTHRVA